MHWMIYLMDKRIMWSLWLIIMTAVSVHNKPSFYNWQRLDALEEGLIDFTFCSAQLWYCEFIELFGRNDTLLKSDPEGHVEIMS